MWEVRVDSLIMPPRPAVCAFTDSCRVRTQSGGVRETLVREEMPVRAGGTQHIISSLLFSSPALQQEILNWGGVMTSWITYITRGILTCVKESLQKANVISDRAATDCFRKERHSSTSDMFRDESMCMLAKAISVPTRPPSPLPRKK